MKSIILFLSSYKSGKFSAVLLSCFTLLLQIHMQLYLLLALILIDFITGVYRSLYDKGIFSPLKPEFWETITSRQMRDTVRKGVEYMLVILASLIVQVIFFNGGNFELMNTHFTIPKAITLGLCAIELYSIFENIKGDRKSLLSKLEDTYIRFFRLFVKGEKDDDK